MYDGFSVFAQHLSNLEYEKKHVKDKLCED